MTGSRSSILLLPLFLLLPACGGDDPVGSNGNGLGQQGSFTATVSGDVSHTDEGQAVFLVADGRTAISMIGGNSFTLNLDIPGGRPGNGTYDVGEEASASFLGQSWDSDSGTATITSSSSGRLEGTLELQGTTHQNGDQATVTVSFSAVCAITAPSCG